MDPLDYRLALLDEGSRERAVLLALSEQCDWRAARRRADGFGLGLAMVRMNGSVVAVAMAVSVDAARVLSIQDVWLVADCGKIVNPSAVRAQMEGGVVWGIGAACLDEITLSGGSVVQSNFHDYRVPRLAQTPKIHVTLIDSESPPGGAGEEAVPPIAAALANAVMAAIGVRIRRLPIAHAGLSLRS